MKRYRTRVAFQRPVVEVLPSGQDAETGEYTTVDGLESVPATIVAVTEERRGERMVITEDRFDIILAGHRPTVEVPMVVLAGDDGVYDVLRVAPTLGRRQTIVMAERVAI